jgi:hypothetical protein
MNPYYPPAVRKTAIFYWGSYDSVHLLFRNSHPPAADIDKSKTGNLSIQSVEFIAD